MKNNFFKNTISMVNFNFKTLIKFEFIYKVLISLLFIPFGLGLFNLDMKITGFTYLSKDNLSGFLLNPLTIISIIFLIAFFTIITIYEISALIVIFDDSYNKKKICLKDVFKQAFFTSKKLFKKVNVMVSFFVLFLIPFLNIVGGSSLITTIKIPEFIMDFINSNKLYFSIYAVIYLILFIILFKWLYSLHYMVLEDKSFKEARKSSAKLIKKNIIKDFINIVLAQFLYIFITLVFFSIGAFVILLINDVLKDSQILQSIIITTIGLLIISLIFVLSIVSNGINYAIISSLFYKHKKNNNEKIVSNDFKHTPIKEKSKKFKIISIILSVIVIFIGSLVVYQFIVGRLNFDDINNVNLDVTAHRGYSKKYPENTMSAFRGAKEAGATWIELDVQQTSDRKIIISHDGNLKRTAGIDKKIIDMKYDELKDVDVGSFFDEKFKGEKIPLLADAIIFAKENNMKLNIELKPNGKEVEFEQDVVDIINQYDFKNDCVIASFNYDVLKRVKEIDSSIKTAYLMSLAIGNISDAQYADVYSIEASNITESLVSRVHESNKQVYAWTINTEESINKMINKNVDNIITDNIELGLQLIQEHKNRDVVDIILDIFNDD